MKATELHWMEGPWPGRLALAARPRGGDWLLDEMAGWRREGVDTIYSLLTAEEERDLDLTSEEAAAASQGMRFFRFPIRDRETPDSESDFSVAASKLESELADGRNVALHCRQGVGRAGLFAVGLLVGEGVDPEAAVRRISAARGVAIPETPEQRRWIDRYAELFAA